MSQELSDAELWVLDIITNLQPSYWELSQFRTIDDKAFGSEELDQILKRLSDFELISVEKEEYQTLIKIKDEKFDAIKRMLGQTWKNKGMEEDVFLSQLEKNAVNFMKLMEFKSGEQNKIHFSFSDYYWDTSLISICDKLVKLGFFFKHTWSSKKHSYLSYYLRSIPFDSFRLVEDFFMRTFRLEGLDLDVDWKIILLTLYSSYSVKIEDIITNLSNLTHDEINDVLSILERRGIIIKSQDSISINKAAKDLTKEYFILNNYQPYKTKITQELKRRIAERPSLLCLIGTVNRILSSASYSRTTEPFWVISRHLIKDYPEKELREASKLGILLLTSNDVIIPHEIVEELQIALQSAFTEQVFRTVPANEIFTAITIFKEIFAMCKDYIKIMDEYINEDTLDIIQSYAPVGIPITILSSIQGARDLDINEFVRKLEQLKTNHKVEIYFIGREPSGIAPFHERYIISKEDCFLISTSLKQVGKSKSASISMIPKDKKETLIGPVFEYWTRSTENFLKEKSITRLSLEAWLATRAR